MKKNFKTYLVVWGLLLTLFNVIAFVAPGWITHEKYTASFWIGYVFISTSLIGQLICAVYAMHRETAKRAFLNIPLISASYGGLIASFIFGGLCMLISSLPYWAGVILCAIVLGLNVLNLIKAKVVVDAIASTDDKIKSATFFIKAMTANAETLLSVAKTDEIKAECKKVYEAVRYSDPMSIDALSELESRIGDQFAVFSDAVNTSNADAAKNAAETLLILIKDRNNKCKLLK